MINELTSKGWLLRGLRHGALLIVLPLFLICLPSLQAFAQHNFIGIGTGGSSGIYFQVGNMICHMLHQEAAEGSGPNIRCIPVSTGGSVDNIRLLRAGKLDFGVVQSDVLYHAYMGGSKFEGSGFKNLRTVFSLHSEPFHVLARKGSGIARWTDLKGKKVNIGNPGSGIRATFDELMAAFQTDKSYLGHAYELNSSEQMQALCRGSIDACGYTVGVPNDSVAHAVQECGATLIPLDAPAVRSLVAERSYFEHVTIRAGSYANIPGDVHTLGVIATVVTTAEQDDKNVYEFVRAVFENLDHIREIHPTFAELDPRKMACRGHAAPLHEAAKKYYSEHGLNVCP